MVKRTLWLMLVLTLLLGAVAGCSPGAKEPAETDSADIAEPADNEDATDAEPEPEDAAPAGLPLETDGEKNAAQLAQSDESRKWASGDMMNGAPVSGEPVLVGYGVLMHDGTTQYQVRVVDGEVVGAFGRSAEPRYIEGPFANYNPTTDPASARQSEAVEAAKSEVAAINPNATRGGIEFYVFWYPPIEEGQYPEVCLYASPTLSDSPHAMGGAYGWR